MTAMALCVVAFGVCPRSARAEPHHKALPPPALLPGLDAWLITLPAPPAAGGAIDSQRVYVPLESHQILALDRETGATIWTREFETALAPTAASGNLYVVGSAELAALDPASGTVRWRMAMERPSIAPVVLAGDVAILPLQAGLIAFRPADGSALWQHALGDAMTTYAIAADDTAVYATTSDGRIVAIALRDGSMRWEQMLPGTLSPPAAGRDRVFVGSTDNFFYAFDAESGRPLWKWRSGGDVIGGAATDDVVYYASLDNGIRALNRSNGNQRWRKSTATRPILPPVARANEVVVVGLSPTLSTYDGRTGAPVGTYAAPGELEGPPLIADTAEPFKVAVVVITRDGRVAALRPKSTMYREAAPLPLQSLPGRALPREVLP